MGWSRGGEGPAATARCCRLQGRGRRARLTGKVLPSGRTGISDFLCCTLGNDRGFLRCLSREELGSPLVFPLGRTRSFPGAFPERTGTSSVAPIPGTGMCGIGLWGLLATCAFLVDHHMLPGHLFPPTLGRAIGHQHPLYPLSPGNVPGGGTLGDGV